MEQFYADTKAAGHPLQTILTTNETERRQLRQKLLQTRKLSTVDICQALPSTAISWIANRRIIVQIIPKIIFKLPSTISEKNIVYR